jgi:hypothetical protein
MDFLKPFDKKSRSAFRQRHRKGDDPEQVIACLECGSDKVRPVEVSVYAGQCHTLVTNKGTHCKGADPAGWGTTINLCFECECGQRFLLNYQYFDQETEFSVVGMCQVDPQCAEPVIYWNPMDEKPRRTRAKR